MESDSQSSALRDERALQVGPAIELTLSAPTQGVRAGAR